MSTLCWLTETLCYCKYSVLVDGDFMLLLVLCVGLQNFFIIVSTLCWLTETLCYCGHSVLVDRDFLLL